MEIYVIMKKKRKRGFIMKEETEAGILTDSMETPSRRAMWGELFKLSWPCAVELFLSSLIGVITVALVASIGKEATNAVSITNQPIMIPVKTKAKASRNICPAIGKPMKISRFISRIENILKCQPCM